MVLPIRLRAASLADPGRAWRRSARGAARLAVFGLLGLSLGACGALTRLSQVGDVPALTNIQNPAVLHNNQSVEMPMPPPVQVAHHANSLWRPGSRYFLKDQRASQMGDIVTVNIAITDSASISNKTTRSRVASEDASASALLGFETKFGRFLPNVVDPTDLIDLDSSASTEGLGTVVRDETIDLKIAAVVTQVLPNGNLVVAGRQEVRVNYEVRELQVTGIIRPEDITSTNTVEFDQIAEARVSYGGRGHISDVQQPRYGQQIFDIIWPF